MQLKLILLLVTASGSLLVDYSIGCAANGAQFLGQQHCNLVV